MSKRSSKRKTVPRGKRKAPGVPITLGDQMTDTLVQAKACWDAADSEGALRLYERAIHQMPHNARTYAMAARAYGLKFRFDDVERIHGALKALAPNHPGVYHIAAENFALLQLPDRAIAEYEIACQLPGVQPTTWVELARLYERANQLDKSEDLLGRAMTAGCQLPLLELTQARVLKRRGKDGQAIDLFNALVAKLPMNSDWACQALGELALIQDSNGEYDRAISTIERCKQGQRPQAELQLRSAHAFLDRFERAADQLTLEQLNRWGENTAERCSASTAMLTGFPRSGTTLLEKILEAHPDLVSSDERDYGRELIHALQTSSQRGMPLLDVLEAVNPQRLVSERGRYLAVMEHMLGEPISGRLHLDKNPAYTLFIPVMLRLFPETRLVVALRDPRDVVISCFLRYLPISPASSSFMSLTEAAGRYAKDMSAWIQMREKILTSWCEVRYEDTILDMEGQVRKILDTLGLEWDAGVLSYREQPNDARIVNSPSYESVSQPIYEHSIGRWRNYEKHMGPVLDLLEPFVDAFGYRN